MRIKSENEDYLFRKLYLYEQLLLRLKERYQPHIGVLLRNNYHQLLPYVNISSSTNLRSISYLVNATVDGIKITTIGQRNHEFLSETFQNSILSRVISFRDLYLSGEANKTK